MTPETFTRACVALFGEGRWQADFSQALGINIRRVRRWRAGAEPIPEFVAEALLEMCGNKRNALNAAIRELIGREQPKGHPA